MFCKKASSPGPPPEEERGRGEGTELSLFLQRGQGFPRSILFRQQAHELRRLPMGVTLTLETPSEENRLWIMKAYLKLIWGLVGLLAIVMVPMLLADEVITTYPVGGANYARAPLDYSRST